jgi:hypothetical protein
LAAIREVREPRGLIRTWMVESRDLEALRRTSSSRRRISAQFWVNSHTSKKRVSAASAKACSSAGVLKLNRRTTSPPYFANKVFGSSELDGCGREPCLSEPALTGFGTRKTFSIAKSRSHVRLGSTFRGLYGCCDCVESWRWVAENSALSLLLHGTTNASMETAMKRRRKAGRKVSGRCMVNGASVKKTTNNERGGGRVHSAQRGMKRSGRL